MKDLPSPFGAIRDTSRKGLTARRFERDVDSLTLRSATYPPLPQFEPAMLDEEAGIIFLPVRANGKNQVAAVIDLLEDIDASMGVDGVDVSEYAVAFLFDADAIGLTATLEVFRDDYGEHFGDLSELEHAKWVATATCPVGVFVFHRTEADETGTLEDHLAPMIESIWPDRYASTRGFIDDNREREPDNESVPQRRNAAEGHHHIGRAVRSSRLALVDHDRPRRHSSSEV